MRRLVAACLGPGLALNTVALGVALGVAVGAASGCSAPGASRPTPIDEPALARMDAEARKALSELGARDRAFDVLDLSRDGGERVELSDDFDFHTHLYWLGLRARVRFLHDVQATPREDLEKRVGAPDWTVDETLDGLVRVEVLGGGLHRAGDDELYAAAIFQDMEPGFRFDRLGARR